VHLSNAEGQAVDPVPFLVMALSACLVSLSFGPFYLRFWGLALDAAIGGSSLLAAAGVLAAYYRYVWSYSPTLANEIPVGSKMTRIAYGMAIFFLVLVGISLPVWL
jgi:hypothetical protein